MMSNSALPDSEKPLPGLEDFYDGFIQDRTAECAQLRDALQKNDFEALRQMGHKWKGFSEPYGFGTLGRLAAQLEEAAKATNATQCQSLLGQCEEYLRNKSHS